MHVAMFIYPPCQNSCVIIICALLSIMNCCKHYHCHFASVYSFNLNAFLPGFSMCFLFTGCSFKTMTIETISRRLF